VSLCRTSPLQWSGRINKSTSLASAGKRTCVRVPPHRCYNKVDLVVDFGALGCLRAPPGPVSSFYRGRSFEIVCRTSRSRASLPSPEVAQTYPLCVQLFPWRIVRVTVPWPSLTLPSILRSRFLELRRTARGLFRGIRIFRGRRPELLKRACVRCHALSQCTVPVSRPRLSCEVVPRSPFGARPLGLDVFSCWMLPGLLQLSALGRPRPEAALGASECRASNIAARAEARRSRGRN
jgi:hypothetical protein